MSIQEMLDALIAIGMTQTEIADQCGSNQSTISRALKGRIPDYIVGKAIERLHLEKCAEINKEELGEQPCV